MLYVLGEAPAILSPGARAAQCLLAGRASPVTESHDKALIVLKLSPLFGKLRHSAASLGKE